MIKNQALLILFVILVFSKAIFAQVLDNDNGTYTNTVNKPYIKTVELKQQTLQLAPPVIILNSADALTLSFDDLRGGVKYYYYTFVHCNQQWEKSGLEYYDYLDGFEKNQIDNYDFSFATSQHYTHYAVSFPNGNIALTKSGNYIIQIWEEDNDSVPVITRRFFVRENIASINAYTIRPDIIAYRNEFQEINFTVDIKNASVTNPYDEIRVTLMQNDRFDNAYYNLKPRLINNNTLTFDDNNTVFPAGKEFRRFDINNLRLQSDRVKKIVKSVDRYDVYINIDDSRSYKQYFYEKDINGYYVLGADLANKPETEADYAYVHFTLQFPYYMTQGEFYVFGALSDYTLSDYNKMTYDFDKQSYEATLYLKQGYYNYMYMFKDSTNTKYDLTYGEGNYFETENQYTIFVYQHEYDKDYDRLIGYTNFNSIKK